MEARNEQAMDEVTIYTDGGCAPNPGPGGWGAVLISAKHGVRRELSGSDPESTNNRMELTAALEALRALKRPCRVTLHTDSQYLRNAFTKGWLKRWQQRGWRTASKKPVANEDLWRDLIEEDARHQVDWRWVRGHSGVPENERCDQLVHEARAKLRAGG